jgi:hypothetical protein
MSDARVQACWETNDTPLVRVAQAIAALFLGTTLVSTVQAQQSGSLRSTTLDRVISPTVMTTYVEGPDELVLLVLWRGTPGWFAASGRGLGSGGSTSGSGADRESISVSAAGLSWTIDVDYASGTARLLDRDISLSDVNVVLVDEVDSADGALVAGTLWIEPSLGQATDPLPTIVGRSPRLAEFLQCDAGLSDPTLRLMLPAICHRITGRNGAAGSRPM